MPRPKTALIVVDVQNDFLPGGSLAVPHGDLVIDPLIKMMFRAQRNGWVIVASRDWHPEDTTHFKINGGVWPIHCVQHTHGAEFPGELFCLLNNTPPIVSKGTESGEDGFSAFAGRMEDGKSLVEFLCAHGVRTVYVGGLATDYCVKVTAISAFLAGFRSILLSDACRAVNLNPNDGALAIGEMVLRGVEVTTTRSVCYPEEE